MCGYVDLEKVNYVIGRVRWIGREAHPDRFQSLVKHPVQRMPELISRILYCFRLGTSVPACTPPLIPLTAERSMGVVEFLHQSSKVLIRHRLTTLRCTQTSAVPRSRRPIRR